MKKILFVANVDKEHILKFHIPTIKEFVDNEWQVDVACAGNSFIPYITNRFKMKWKRNPISLNIFSEIKKLKQIIINNNYDIVYCHTPTGGLASRIACKSLRKTGLKVVYFAHGFHFYKGAPLLNWLLYYPIEKVLSKYTDLLITLNDEDFSLAKKHFSRKMKVALSNGVGVDLERFSSSNLLSERARYRSELNICENQICLGYVAEIIKNKNQSMLLKCLKELQDRSINVKLVLVGPDHTSGRFRKTIIRNGLESSVICTGWREDANSIISAFDFCTPSSIREGLGLNLIEAMEKGIPVVANDNRGHRSVIKSHENGILVKKNDYIEMANAIEYLSNDPSAKNKIINNAKETAIHYEQKVVTLKLFNIISNLAKQ